MDLLLMSIALASCVLGVAFVAMYYLNKAVDRTDG
jgi:hypothetical protein